MYNQKINSGKKVPADSYDIGSFTENNKSIEDRTDKYGVTLRKFKEIDWLTHALRRG